MNSNGKPSADTASAPTTNAATGNKATLRTTPTVEPAPQATPKAEPDKPVKILTPADLIAQKMNSYRQIILINKQLNNLQFTLEELEKFEYNVERDDDDRYGAELTILDDQRRKFTTKNATLLREVVDYLKKRLTMKIEEKQVDLLSVQV